MRVEISVTAEDIADGRRGSCTKCPIALAIRRLFPDAGSILTGPNHLRMLCRSRGWQACTPPIAVGFIEAFDRGLPVEPFTFTADFT